MPVYLTPGVYRAPQPKPQPSLVPVRTDVAAFVGYTERGPLAPANPDLTFHSDSVTLKITSWTEYQANFGSFHSYGYLPFAVRAFFENGGQECYVTRVAAIQAANMADRPAVAVLPLPAGAASAGVALTAPVAAGDTEVKVAGAGDFQAGDIVQLSSPAFQVLGVVDHVAGSSVFLTEPCNAPFDVASGHLQKFPQAALIKAKSPGAWGNRVFVRLQPLDSSDSSLQFALRVIRPGDDWSATEEEFYQKLSIDPNDAANDALYAPTVLARSSLISLWASPTAPPVLLHDGPLKQAQRLIGGRDGLAAVTKEDFVGGQSDYRGLRLLEEIDDIAIVCIPDAVFSVPPPPPPDHPVPPDPCSAPPPAASVPPPDPTSLPPSFDAATTLFLQQSMLEHCYRLRYRVAVIDPPVGLLPTQAQSWASQLRGATGKFGALYYPWIDIPDPRTFDAPAIPVPPSGHVAGIYARNDLKKGVRKPPANEPLNFITDLEFDVDDDAQGDLNDQRVNCIRTLPGRGIRVWGARSLSAPSDSKWMFIHVRRLMSYIEASVERSSRWAVFEPNDDGLRRAIVHSLTVFLERIWQSGGLLGTVPAEGFYVRCDGTNNPPAVVDQGQLICEVGIAVAAPMEFIVFEIRRNVESAQVVEEEQSL